MKYLLIIMLAVYSYGLDLSPKAQNGREIYMDSDCQRCHKMDEKYDGKGSYANDAFRLRKWVSSCMVYFGHSWFPEEQENVVIYLNEIEYKIDLSNKDVTNIKLKY